MQATVQTMIIPMNKDVADKKAKTIIDSALGALAKYAVVGNDDIAFFSEMLAKGQKPTKEQIMKRLTSNKKNEKLIIAASEINMIDADKAVTEEYTSDVVLAAKAEQAEGGGTGTTPPKAQEISDPKAKNEVKAIKVDANADVTKIVALAENIAEKKEPTSVQIVNSYTAMVNAGGIPQAPMAVTAEYKAQQETFKTMKEDGFKGMRLASLEKAEAFAENRNKIVLKPVPKPIILLVPSAPQLAA